MFIEELAGPEVLVIDNTDREVKSLLESLDELEIRNEYIKVDLAGDRGDHALVNTVKLVFLDLYYGPVFDAGFCANLISEVVPVGKQYYLVAWTKDPDKADSVIEELRLLNLAPIAYTSKRKEEYRKGNDIYDINRLLNDINVYFEQIKDVDNYYGRIVEVEDNQVLINCVFLVKDQKPVYQIRRFDKTPLENYIDLKPGVFVIIRVVTKPGSRLFEFSTGSKDLVKYFPDKEEYFKTINSTTLFDQE